MVLKLNFIVVPILYASNYSWRLKFVVVCIQLVLDWFEHTQVFEYTLAVDKPPEEVHNTNGTPVLQLLSQPGQEPPNSYCCTHCYSTHYCNTLGLDIHYSMPMLATKWLHQSGTMLQVTSSCFSPISL